MRVHKTLLRGLPLFLLAATLVGRLEAAEKNVALNPDKNFTIISRLIVNILAEEHYQGKMVDDKISRELFDSYLKLLDPSHFYFTQKDVDALKADYDKLDDQLREGDTAFAFKTYNALMEKVRKREDFAAKCLREGFDFTQNVDYVFDRAEAPWAKDEVSLDEVWRQRLKYDILNFRLMKKAMEEDPEAKNKSDTPAFLKKTPEERVMKRLTDYRRHLEENDPSDILGLYLSALSQIYDPHSCYMSPRANEDFNIQMRLSLVGIGALLTSEDGYTKIVKIMPGGPAERDKRLKTDDRIIAVAQGDDGEPVDVVDMPLNKVVNMIRGQKGSKVRLTILEGDKGARAIPKEITLVRDDVQLKDQEASGEIRNVKSGDGSQLRIGVLTLPSFYYDFEGASRGKTDFKSSTRDVKNILADFKEKKVDGVVVDLRSNGGGSLKEAIDLTGLFIYTGPVVQIRNQRGDVRVENDEDPTCAYEGPLLVMVNRMSASATEIFAGAIQDYGRGVVIGEQHTHGKGTVQTVFELDPFLARFGLGFKSGSIKLTNAKFYRVSGSSTQHKGVAPDIAFSSFTDYMDIGEGKLDHALPWDKIDATNYSSFNKIQRLLPELRKLSEERRVKDAEFKKLDQSIAQFRKLKEKKTVSLNERTRWEQYVEEKNIAKEQKALYKSTEEDDNGPDDSNKDTRKDIFLNESEHVLADYIGLCRKEEKREAVAATVGTKDKK